MFWIYISDLPDGLKSECKLFVDDTSLRSVVHDISNLVSDLNEDLQKMSSCSFKWKMNFNPDPNKQASLRPVVHFDNRPVKSTQIQKHLGMVLVSNLCYETILSLF